MKPAKARLAELNELLVTEDRQCHGIEAGCQIAIAQRPTGEQARRGAFLMGDQSDKIKSTGKDETKPPNQEAGPGTGETAAAKDSSEEGVSKLADKAQELVAAAREKA